MKITAIKTAVLRPPKDDLLKAIANAIPLSSRKRTIPEKTILVITSKVVSIWQGRCVPALHSSDPVRVRREKDALVRREADRYLPREATPGGWCMHTIKNNIFIPSAGVDESNADGYYILWPRDVAGAARTLWKWLRRHYGVRELGVVITDSHTIPLRRGVMGISLAHYGFAPLREDLYYPLLSAMKWKKGKGGK